MANSTITDLPTASGIDAAVDWLAIDRTSLNTTQKINRNTLLGIAGAPVGTTDSQTLTNKVITSPTLTVLDNAFTIQDNVDPTKQAQFQLSGITAGQTRTYTLPDASGTIADIASAQTFTNKTLTAPVITNGSITGTTITTDAIVGQSAATTGTVYGLSISSGTIGSAGIASSAVTAVKIGSAAVTPEKLIAGTGSTWVWQDWTPTFTNVSGGTLVYAKFIQIGKTVFFRIKYTMGGAGISGQLQLSLPVTASSTYDANATELLTGAALFTDTGVASYPGIIRLQSSTTIQLRVQNASATYTTGGDTSSTAPFTWASGDAFIASGCYEAA